MTRHPLFDLLSRAALPAACILVAAYFLSHATFGAAGLLSLGSIRQESAALQARKQQLTAERDAMQRRIDLLDPRKVDPDYADELVRQQLGVVRPDEIIVPLESEKRQPIR
ncbi:FtsB family cell division protein [Sandaracinobacteroides saxicola]|uniref:Septum formation initiator family protein n=1 Tax=Sandaracinobacteroides saxicola TaxID=2759707 RepID=A0A7G5IJL8_9SPHN|nr:septum formation initiator family protein [Sandaracinobacteroides saxicola]QMW23560.1 septum formation initiator family protein [Sandaracinobacteroides saxicola]